MAARSHAQRIFIITIVVVFFLTSAAFTAFAIWEQSQADKRQREQEQALSALNNQNNQENKVKLEGTKLADFTPVDNVAKLEKIDLKEGTGDAVKPGDDVTAHYTGALAKDGTIFQSSFDSGAPVPFNLSGVIKGWTDGVPGMKVGGKRRLIIPAEQAYGADSRPGIPANSDLVFDIELVKIGQ